MKMQFFRAAQRPHREGPEQPMPENGRSRSRGVSKMDSLVVNMSELSIFPRKNPQQQKTGFAGHRFSLGNNDGFEGVIMSYL